MHECSYVWLGENRDFLTDRDISISNSPLLAGPGCICGFLSSLGGGLFPSQGLGWEGNREEEGGRRRKEGAWLGAAELEPKGGRGRERRRWWFWGPRT